MLISGIDEAGRGPVFGPLVLSIATLEEEKEPELESLGVADSKKLGRGKREELFPKIMELCRCSIISISAAELNRRMGRESLNLIEAKAMGELALKVGGRVYIDLPQRNCEGFLRKARLFGRDVVAEHKADSRYPIVGAASIISKVTRDRAVMELQRKCGDIGSGYCSDEKTVEALNNPETRKMLGEEIRTRWSTMERVAHPKLGEFCGGKIAGD